jgi:hypothetical protein
LKPILLWGLVALTLAVYGTMLGWSLPTVSAAAGGLAPFDMRPGGYGFAEAQAFLVALTAAGAEFYRNVQQRLDLVYPGLMALTLGLAIATAAPKAIGRWRWLALPLAASVALFDYLENHAIANMLDAGAAALTPELVETASRWTVLKSAATTAAMVILLVLLLVKATLWLVHRRPRPA